MKENIKLSIWDAFAFYLSGWTIIASAYIHVVFHDASVNNFLKEIPTTALGFGAFLIPLIVGLLFEPIANRLGDLVVFVAFLIRRCSRAIVNWFKPSRIPKASHLVKLVESDMPSAIVGAINPYHWAKDYLSQEKVDTSYMAFLSKFGFYRNIGALLLINAFLVPCLYGLGPTQKASFCVLIAGSALYYWRSRKFYNHMGDYMFRHYVVLLERSKRNPKPNPVSKD